MSEISVTIFLRAIAIASGGAALALAAVARSAFRGSPFGNLLALLVVLLVLFTGLSVASLTTPGSSLVLELVEAVTYTWLLVFAVMLVRVHDRLARLPRRDGRD